MPVGDQRALQRWAYCRIHRPCQMPLAKAQSCWAMETVHSSLVEGPWLSLQRNCDVAWLAQEELGSPRLLRMCRG